MRLYLKENPRTLYLVTDAQDEPERPSRALVFRAAEEGSSSQAVVQFLPKVEVDLSTTIKLASGRVIRGCLGLISVSNGAPLRASDQAHDADALLEQKYSWSSSRLRPQLGRPAQLYKQRNPLRKYTMLAFTV